MTRAVWLIGIIVLGTACSGTATDDQRSADSETTVTIDPRLVPTTSIVFSGTALELLPQLGVEMSRLSSQISEDGDEDKATRGADHRHLGRRAARGRSDATRPARELPDHGRHGDVGGRAEPPRRCRQGVQQPHPT